MELYNAIIDGTPNDFTLSFPATAYELRDRIYAVLVSDYNGGLMCELSRLKSGGSAITVQTTPYLKNPDHALAALIVRLNGMLGFNVLKREYRDVSDSALPSLVIRVDEWWDSPAPVATFDRLYLERVEAM